MFNESPVTISIDQEKCRNCNKCDAVCPVTRVFGFESIREKRAGEVCIRCGNCMAVCPTGAIAVAGLPAAEPMGKFPTATQMLSLIKGRRTARAFRKEKIKEDDWQKLIEAVNYSPTGHNAQYIDLMIIESTDLLQKMSEIGMHMLKKFKDRLLNPLTRLLYRKILGDHTASVFHKAAFYYREQLEYFERGNDPILFNAPALILFIGPKSELMSKNDADLAAQTVALLAPTLGLGTCYSGIVTAAFGGVYPGIKKIIKIPDSYSVFNALIIGYPQHKFPFVSPRKQRNVTYL